MRGVRCARTSDRVFKLESSQILFSVIFPQPFVGTSIDKEESVEPALDEHSRKLDPRTTL